MLAPVSICTLSSHAAVAQRVTDSETDSGTETDREDAGGCVCFPAPGSIQSRAWGWGRGGVKTRVLL